MVAGRCFEHACRGRLTVGYPTSGRDFFSTHFDINYLPENQARTEALWKPARMAVVLHVTAEEGSRLWHGFAGQGRLCFQEGSGSKPEPYSVEVSRARFCQ